MGEKRITYQAISFLLISIVATVLSYLLFLFLFKFIYLHYLIAVLISYVFGITLSFPFYEKHTFNSKEKRIKSSMIYFLINLYALVFSLSSLHLVVNIFQTNISLTYLFVLALTSILKFLGFKVLAFKNKIWR